MYNLFCFFFLDLSVLKRSFEIFFFFSSNYVYLKNFFWRLCSLFMSFMKNNSNKIFNRLYNYLFSVNIINIIIKFNNKIECSSGRMYVHIRLT